MHATAEDEDLNPPIRDADGPPPPSSGRKGISLYVIECGRERIRYRPMQKTLVPTSLRYTSFHGACFMCKCMAHSQKFCPLRKCNLCFRYGHAEVSCPYKKKGFTK